MSNNYSNVAEISKKYYDSNEADEFYHSIWGGEDIHIGIYENENDKIVDASCKTVRRMANLLNLDETKKVLDIGSGYGGAARFLAKNYKCKVDCLNISEKENERNREKNKLQNLDHLISVQDGSFEDLPFPDNTFDVVWSEDAILHSGEKDKVFQEVFRVLKDGGEFIFTDPMQADDCSEGVLKDVYARIHLDSMGSFGLYEKLADKQGFKKVQILDLSSYLPKHYSRVSKDLQNRYDEIIKISSKEYVDKMLTGLSHWVNAGNNGYLKWGILHFKK